MTKPSGSHQHIPHVAPPFLDEADRLTLDAMFTQPLPYLGWNRVVALFNVLGNVEPRRDNEFAFRIGSEHHMMQHPPSEDLQASDVIGLRHLVTRAGLAPTLPASHPDPAPQAQPDIPGLLVAIDHHGARIFSIDVGAVAPAEHTIKPYDPHGYLHHLAHKDESRERGQRAPEEPAYYGRIAETIMTGAHIVVVGHGHGHSDAARHLVEYLQAHHPDIYGRTVTEVVADLSALTEPQLLDLGRRALQRQEAKAPG